MQIRGKTWEKGSVLLADGAWGTEFFDVIAIRSMMNLVAGYDHRATDGAQVGQFVRDVICWLEAIGPDSPIY